MSVQNQGFIADAIERAVKDRIDQEVDLALQEAQERVGRAVRAAVGQIVLSVMQRYSVERMGNDIIIRVKIDG